MVDWKQIGFRCALLAVGIVCLTVLAVKGIIAGSVVIGAVTTSGGYLTGLLQATPKRDDEGSAK